VSVCLTALLLHLICPGDPPTHPRTLASIQSQECEESAPPGLWEAAGIRKLTARDGFRALVLSLWDPEQRCYVAFPEWQWLERQLAPPKTSSAKAAAQPQPITRNWHEP